MSGSDCPGDAETAGTPESALSDMHPALSHSSSSECQSLGTQSLDTGQGDETTNISQSNETSMNIDIHMKSSVPASNKSQEISESRDENTVTMAHIEYSNQDETCEERHVHETVHDSRHLAAAPEDTNSPMHSHEHGADLQEHASQTQLHSTDIIQNPQDEGNSSVEQESCPNVENSYRITNLSNEKPSDECGTVCDSSDNIVEKNNISDFEVEANIHVQHSSQSSNTSCSVGDSDFKPGYDSSSHTMDDKDDELLSQLEDELQSQSKPEGDDVLPGNTLLQEESLEQSTVSLNHQTISYGDTPTSIPSTVVTSHSEQVSLDASNTDPLDNPTLHADPSDNHALNADPSDNQTANTGSSDIHTSNADGSDIHTHTVTHTVTVGDENTGQGDLLPNGIPHDVVQTLPEFSDLQTKYNTLQKLYAEKDVEIKRLYEEKIVISKSLQNALKEKDSIHERIKKLDDKALSEERRSLARVKELEAAVAREKQEHEATRERLRAQDEAARRHVAQLQHDLTTRLNQVTRAYEESKREKEGMVVKYAMAEQKNIDMENRMQKNNKRTQDMEKEKNLAINKFNTMRAEKTKVEEIFGQRNAEILALRRDVERMKELLAEQELKTKWHQGKLRHELEAHKETKGKLDEVNKKLKQGREEADAVRRECQQLIKQHQESELHKSSTLSARLGERESELARRAAEAEDQQEAHSLVRSQLDTLKRNHKDMVEELRTARDKITCLEAERIHQEETLERFKNTLQSQKQDNKFLYDKLAALEDIEQQHTIEKERACALQTRVAELEEAALELRSDMEACAGREAKHLEFTHRVSDTNAKLQGDYSQLTGKLEQATADLEALDKKYRTLLQSSQSDESELSGERERRIAEVGALTVKVEEKSKAVEELTQQLEDQRDENKTLKRRHQANVKDLHRQLQQAQRKLEKGSLNGEISSMGSRTSSNNSLNTIGAHEMMPPPIESPPIQEQAPVPQEAEAPLVQFVEVDKQVLVEKIVRLQRAHARKNEKLDFMQEHITQLLGELQKKTKVIQSYVLREETGALAPEAMDLNKAQISRKGGIMASVYNHQARDGHMTIDLSLQINHKLQAVLEDTILKNITLKESMDTLGSEISHLSQQNRDLQLQLQQFTMKSSKTS